MTDESRIALPGTIWVCRACGKTAKDRYGDKNSSWDESCMLNAVLCHEHKKFDKDGLLKWAAYSRNKGSEK